MKPSVSIVIPVYNAGCVLSATLNSILGQSMRDLELIVVDDGTTDDTTLAILAEARRDGRVKVLTQENKGVFAARNAGLMSASGEYVYFCDQDDLLHPQALEYLVWACRSNDLDFMSFWNSESLGGEMPRAAKLAFASLPLAVVSNDEECKAQPAYNAAIKAVRLDVWGQFARRCLSAAIPFRDTFDISRVFKLINASRRWAVSRCRDLYFYNRNVESSMSRKPYRARLIHEMHIDLSAIGDEFRSEIACGDVHHVWHTVRKHFLSRCLKMQINAVRRHNDYLDACERRQANVALADEIGDLLSKQYVKLSDLSFVNAIKCVVFMWRYGTSKRR